MSTDPLGNLLDALPDPVFVFDDTPELASWNDAATRSIGYEAGEQATLELTDLFPVEEVARVQATIEETLETGASRLETEIVSKNGLRTHLTLHCSQAIDEEAQPVLVGIGRDVSERKPVPAERTETEKRLEQLLDQVSQAAVATDADGTITYWNKHAEELYGYEATEAIGEDIFALTIPDPEEDQHQVREIIAALAKGDSWEGQLTAQGDDGSTFPAFVSNSPMMEEGTLVGVISTSHDLTGAEQRERDLVRLTNQLHARNRELRELSQATAHEFHTPISDVVRHLSLLANEAGDRLTEEEHAHLETARQGAYRMDDLVESLQEFLAAATRRPAFEMTYVEDVLDEVLEDLSAPIDETGAEITVDPSPPRVVVDGAQLAAALRHLIENALRFSGDGPPVIHIGFEQAEDMWMISVSDEGEGIDPQYHERIFRPFRVLHGVADGGGPGLGLALCRGTAEAHGGSIWVNSRAGEGSTFYMTLPSQDATPSLPESRGSGLGLPGDPHVWTGSEGQAPAAPNEGVCAGGPPYRSQDGPQVGDPLTGVSGLRGVLTGNSGWANGDNDRKGGG